MQKERIILYVDDDAEDREFLSHELTKVDPYVEVKLAEDGLQALRYLDTIKGTRLPCLIVLDLNMPFLDGREIHQRIKTDEVLQAVPVVIFSSSEKPDDKRSFAEMGTEYFTKPVYMDQLKKIASHMVSLCCKC